MTRYERDALAVIRDEHRQTRRPVAEAIVRIGCNATAQAERDAVGGALRRLREKGMISASQSGHVPTTRGLCADLEGDTEEEVQAAVVLPVPDPKPLVKPATPVVPDGLLNRCAAMHMALFAEVQAAYERGEEGAAGEMVWMIETGRLLLAAGGEA